MAKYCADCEYINTSDKKCDGIYKCKKCKCYVSSCSGCCENFSESYSRNWYEKQKLYDLGKKKSQDTIPITMYVVVFILLCILYFVGKMMGY